MSKSFLWFPEPAEPSPWNLSTACTWLEKRREEHGGRGEAKHFLKVLAWKWHVPYSLWCNCRSCSHVRAWMKRAGLDKPHWAAASQPLVGTVDEGRAGFLWRAGCLLHHSLISTCHSKMWWSMFEKWIPFCWAIRIWPILQDLFEVPLAAGNYMVTQPSGYWLGHPIFLKTASRTWLPHPLICA